jgi:acyl carrier protein
MPAPYEEGPSATSVVVVEAFRDHLGIGDALPLERRLLEDLGVDSIAFVTLLMDLADELGLDLGSARIALKRIRTLQDVVALVDSLQPEERQAA